MPAPLKLANLDNLIRDYYAGEPLTQLAIKCGVSETGIRGVFERAGVKFRTKRQAYKLRKGPALREMPVAEIVARYTAGESEKSLADSFNVDRAVIRRRLLDSNVKIRGRSDAELVKWAKIKTSRPAVVRQCSAAWKAATGRDMTPAVKARMASGSYRGIGKRRGKWETELCAELLSRGIVIEPQYPIFAYNIDIAVPKSRIAVEVVGTNWHPEKFTFQEHRAIEICGAKWSIVYVHVWRKSPGPVNISAVADYLAALCKVARRDKSIRGKYRMINGHSQPLSGAGYKFDGLPLIP